jgi:hypothetical protein
LAKKHEIEDNSLELGASFAKLNLGPSKKMPSDKLVQLYQLWTVAFSVRTAL